MTSNQVIRSDHSLIDMQLDLNQIDRGKGYWKFNNSLLTDPNYAKLVKEIIWETVEEYAASPYSINGLRNVHQRDIHFTINDQLFLRFF